MNRIATVLFASRTASQAASFALAAMVTVSVLAGLDGLAVHGPAALQPVQATAPVAQAPAA